eukprot:346072_1
MSSFAQAFWPFSNNVHNSSNAALTTITMREMMNHFEALRQIVSEQQSLINGLRNHVDQIQQKQDQILSHVDLHSRSKPSVNRNVHSTTSKHTHDHIHEERKTNDMDTETQQCVCTSTVNKCEYLQQLQVQMKQYDNEDTIDHDNIQSILDNFGHLMLRHNHHEYDLADEFESIYNILGGYCDIQTCTRFKRHQVYRERDHKCSQNTLKDIYNVDDDTEVTHKQIMDKIHCFYRHCYDIGNRLTPDEEEQMILSKRENGDAFPIFKKHQKTCGKNVGYLGRYKKFTLFGKVCDDTKSQTSTRTQPMFSLGYEFRYDDAGYGDHLVHKKYQSLKEELISNDVAMLTTDQFSNELRKSMLYFHSFYCKKWMDRHQEKCQQKKLKKIEDLMQERMYHSDSDQTEWERNENVSADILSVLSTNYDTKQLQMHHILSLMVYCNFTDLQFAFSATYRKKTLNEPDECVLDRHSTFYHLGKYLKEVVDWFGTEVGKNDAGPTRFYHGINDEFTFPKFVNVDIYSPLSTTTRFSVAAQFATESGVIVTLKSSAHKIYYSKLNYISVDWLSDYGNESECLFVQSGGRFDFENIILVEAGIQLSSVFRCIRHLDTLHSVRVKFEAMTSMHDQQLLQSLIENELYRKLGTESKYNKCHTLHKYAETIFHQYCINIDSIHTYKEKMVPFLNHFFMVDEYPKWDWIDLNVLCALFPNIEVLFYDCRPGNGDFDLYLCNNTMENIYQHFEKINANKQYSKLVKIKFHGISATRGNLTLLKAYNSYKECFEKIGVTLEKDTHGNQDLLFTW